MTFDKSRVTFNPWNDYLGVVMQQGRVQLDSDWNESLSEIARRIQAGALDILGLSGVPSTTPYGFAINVFVDNSGPHITIGAGRIYVDGLLVENHGPAGSAQWDPALAEWSGAPQPPAAPDSLDYTNQPYYPGAVFPTGPGPFLVYLDVWQREVSYLEDPNLIDKAVGVDTTGRLQTVWQVKLLDVSGVVGGVACSTPDATIAPWEEVIQPSPSLLTVGVVPAAPSGPCALSPAAGYSGLENQLYRVEIQRGGAAGTATFKWSRENASVATAVIAISSVTNSGGATASQLTVQSLGRDQVLGFTPGNWIEIIDDYRELNPPLSHGQPQAGELHQIDSVNPAAKTITLGSVVSAAFPVNSAGQTDPTRHTRIRRWDQSGNVYTSDGATVFTNVDAGTGDIPVPPAGTALILENGITVAFDLASSGSWNSTTTYTPGQIVTSGGQFYACLATNHNQAPPNAAFWAIASFQTGDFWTFAARTADGSVEIVTQPPATAWNAAATYVPGQIVTSGDNYYACLVANSNQPPPNAAFWAAPQVAPSGTDHHYCRLGTINFTGTATVTDCRPVFQSLANPAIHVTGVVLGSGIQLQNDGTFSIQGLSTGIQVGCDVPVDPAIITQPAAQVPPSMPLWDPVTQYNPGDVVFNGGNCFICVAANSGQTPPNVAFWTVAQFNSPVCFVTVDLPFPATPPAAGFNPLTLSATVSVATSTTSSIITWTPTPTAITALSTAIGQISPGAPPLLARLKLKGNCIWAAGNPAVYLNGATAGAHIGTGSQSTTGLQLPSGDGRVSADFDMWFWLISQPLVTLSAPALNFGPQAVGTSSAPQSVTLANNSPTDALTFPGAGIGTSGTNAGDFTVSNTCGTSVPPGGTCTISVTFTPMPFPAASTRTAQIDVAESVDASPLVVALTGFATAPQVSVSVTSLTFAAQAVSTTSAAQAVTLQNTGTAALTISSVVLTAISNPPPGVPVFAGDFVQTSNCIPPGGSGTLQPGGTCTISVQFSPSAIGARYAQLVITHNAAGSPLLVPLTGTGVVLKVRDVKIIREKVSDVVKTSDVFKLQDVKLRDVVLPRIEGPAPGVPDAADESATRRAFISPEERPSVAPPSSDAPDDEPPKDS